MSDNLPVTSWTWEGVDPKRSGSSGDLSKLFRNTKLKRPGLFTELATTLDATALAREVVQNSWDSALQRRKQEAASGHRPEFELEFRFERLTGDKAEEMATTLDLAGLRERARAFEDEDKLSQLVRASIVGSDDEGHLSVLRITESGTTGMYGNWGAAESKMYFALVSVGYTEKGEVAGGSYGYGKAGLIRASRARVVLAYSCFDSVEGDPATRRLLGMTYWSPHDTKEGKWTGFARLGKNLEEGVVPFVDEEADRVAAALGMETRALNWDGSSGKGTTFIVLDPVVKAEQLQHALEDNWWPAIEDADDFFLTVIDSDETERAPAPDLRSHLLAFLRGYELARSKPDAKREDEDHYVPRRFTTGSGKSVMLGALGLKAETNSWSYPRNTEIEHRSLVALVRGPKMVVEYADMGMARPFVRGTFIADDDVDELLRQTEPPAHDAWIHASQDEDIPQDARDVAEAIQRRVRGGVDDFRKRLRPPKVDARQVRLPEFEDLFGSVLTSSGTRNVGPDPVPRDVSIQIQEQKLEPAGAGIRLVARCSFALTDRIQEDERAARLRVTYKFDEDGRAGTEVHLDYELPPDFELEDDGFISGILSHDSVEVSVVSRIYDSDWTARLTVEADLVGEYDGVK